MVVKGSTDAKEDEPMEISPGILAQPVSEQVTSQSDRCSGCDEVVTDRYLLKVAESCWHVRCLKCCICQCDLGLETSCYTKDRRIYCKADYAREFGAKCSSCLRNIQASDWVRKARNNVYHLACFSCAVCARQLSTGEEFALQDTRVYCKVHYVELLEASVFCPSSDEQGSLLKPKRIRTTFSEDQLQILNANFNLDPNPDGHDLERIAKQTGLSKRVTQVWFQNSRARQKKQSSNSE